MKTIKIQYISINLICELIEKHNIETKFKYIKIIEKIICIRCLKKIKYYKR